MAKTTSKVYSSLSQDEQSKTVVYTQNYGEAGALEYYAKKYNLPPVLCHHNNYFYWWDTRKQITTVIIIGGQMEDHQQSLEKVEKIGTITCNYCMPYENNLPIYLGRILKRPLKEIRQARKIFI